MSYKSARSCELDDSEQEKESLFQQNRSFTQPQGISHCFSKWSFSSTRENRTGLFCSLQQPSPTPAWHPLTFPMATGNETLTEACGDHKHTTQLGALLRDQQWVMNDVTMHCKWEKTPRCYPCIPRNQCKNRLCPLLSHSKNLSGAKETSLQKASTGVDEELGASFCQRLLFEQLFCLSTTSTAAHRGQVLRI